jgi:hypothetical protein
MARVGPWRIHREGSTSCTVKLDSGERIVIKHDVGAFQTGWVTIDRVKLFQLLPDRVFACNLDSKEGKTALAWLTWGIDPKSPEATPLGAFVKYLGHTGSIDEIRARCRALMAIGR